MSQLLLLYKILLKNCNKQRKYLEIDNSVLKITGTSLIIRYVLKLLLIKNAMKVKEYAA
jgi:uncharacterized protein with PQ loop repeat